MLRRDILNMDNATLIETEHVLVSSVLSAIREISEIQSDAALTGNNSSQMSQLPSAIQDQLAAYLDTLKAELPEGVSTKAPSNTARLLGGSMQTDIVALLESSIKSLYTIIDIRETRQNNHMFGQGTPVAEFPVNAMRTELLNYKEAIVQQITSESGIFCNLSGNAR